MSKVKFSEVVDAKFIERAMQECMTSDGKQYYYYAGIVQQNFLQLMAEFYFQQGFKAGVREAERFHASVSDSR